MTSKNAITYPVGSEVFYAGEKWTVEQWKLPDGSVLLLGNANAFCDMVPASSVTAFGKG